MRPPNATPPVTSAPPAIERDPRITSGIMLCAMAREPKLRDEGEFGLIARLAERLPRNSSAQPANAEILVGIGDDAAVTSPRGATVTSTEAFVEGFHFRREWSPPPSIGRKALAAALSDLAAMGAEPGEAYVALGIPDDFDEAACLELYDGIAAVAADTGTAVIGGDLTRAPVLVLAVTVVGHASSPEAVAGRDGASPGEAVAVTGELGGAAAGLLLLEQPELRRSLDAGVADALVRRQLEPAPRIAAGSALASAGATAMIDLSDGLGADAGQIAAASGVRVTVDLERLPAQPGVPDVAAAAAVDPSDLTVAGGEDYELLVVLPAARIWNAAAAVGSTGSRLTVVGETRPGEGVELSGADGSIRPPAGFDHLPGR
jgi:thiamine-monophosphate kinase